MVLPRRDQMIRFLCKYFLFQMEKIKRANSLWTSDSLFCRSHLNIPIETPITQESFLNNKSESSSGSGSNKSKLYNGKTSSYEEVNYDDVHLEEALPSSIVGNGGTLRLRKDPNFKENLCHTSQLKEEKVNGFNVQEKKDLEEEESIADFLIRIDSYIAKSKNQVNSINQKSRLPSTYSDDNIYKSSVDKSSSSTYLRRQHSARNGMLSFGRPLEESKDQLELLNMAHGRKVASSLRKLEKQQDELFQL